MAENYALSAFFPANVPLRSGVSWMQSMKFKSAPFSLSGQGGKPSVKRELRFGEKEQKEVGLRVYRYPWNNLNTLYKEWSISMETKNNRKKSRGRMIILIAVLAVIAVGMFGLYQTFMPKGEAGEKTLTVTVVHGDKSEEQFTYHTKEAYLGPVITNSGLVEGENGDYGLFIKAVDGETADDSKQQWWCITKGGETVNASADQTPIEDGDQFELTLKEGY